MKKETACAGPASRWGVRWVSGPFRFFIAFVSPFGDAGSPAPEAAGLLSAPLGGDAFLPRAALSKDLLSLSAIACSRQPAASFLPHLLPLRRHWCWV